MRTFFALAVIFSLASPAFAGRRVFIYPTGGSVSYTGQPGQSGCRLSVTETEPAEILEERNGYVRVSFSRQNMQGCYGDQLFGRDVQSGWIPSSEISYGEDDQSPVTIPPAKPCPEKNLMQEQKGLRDAAAAIKDKAAGLKSAAEIEKYLECFPNSKDGRSNYLKYSPFIDRAAANFSFKKDGADYSVNPSMLRCLLRRESAYNPASKSQTGAVGLGQHTDVNIRHINNRLKEKNSWERQLWDRFFSGIKSDPQAQSLMSQCPRTAGGQPPKFESKADAACPLQSLAASAIYNLQIQESLRRSSGMKAIPAKQELDYQVSIGAAYNLGDGAASKAVSDLYVGGWVDAIKNRAPTEAKGAEVSNHVAALRNCMQSGNWSPMHPKDPPRCENFPGAKAKTPMPIAAPKGAKK